MMLRARVLALAERDEAEFLACLDRSGFSVQQVERAFGQGPA